ncbi:family 2B encapsulin nanocompartment shell protein [Nonomuraea sp. NPDC048826]|uniref:family 2B encapsulin nanocompartment shell protein n=1 Tax=Nonomuraea sp. NPDC048826 TaxID=3364347 RepID=UPI0037140D0D
MTEPDRPLSLGTPAARTLATTTKTAPQTQESSPRWLLRALPWVELSAGSYRVNRRLTPTPERPDPRPLNRRGEVAIELASGHSGEPTLPGTFPDYDPSPREYELSVSQAVVRIHTRVADLYSDPMDQTREQLRLTVEAVREAQERELVGNPAFGLLHSAGPAQRLTPRSGPPAPADLDALLTRRRKTRYLLANPLAIAAFGRQCSAAGVYPDSVEVDGSRMTAWRGVPILPCDKIPVSRSGTSSILALRTGEDDQGVVGLHPAGIPDEYRPGLSVRVMGIDERGITTYLVSAYYSVAVLVPDALGVLDDVEVYG